MASISPEAETNSASALPFWHQIRWHLIATFVLVALVPAIIVATITNSLARNQAKNHVFDQLESVADLKRDQALIGASSAALSLLLAQPVNDQLLAYAQGPSADRLAPINALLTTATTLE